MMDFHTRLVSELIQLDQRESKRKGWNPYALAQYLAAAEDVHDARTFARAFTATRGMHRVARNLSLPLDVERGEWILLED